MDSELVLFYDSSLSTSDETHLTDLGRFVAWHLPLEVALDESQSFVILGVISR